MCGTLDGSEGPDAGVLHIASPVSRPPQATGTDSIVNAGTAAESCLENADGVSVAYVHGRTVPPLAEGSPGTGNLRRVRFLVRD